MNVNEIKKEDESDENWQLRRIKLEPENLIPGDEWVNLPQMSIDVVKQESSWEPDIKLKVEELPLNVASSNIEKKKIFPYERDNDILFNHNQLKSLISVLIYYEYEGANAMNSFDLTNAHLQKGNYNLGLFQTKFISKTLKVYFRKHLILSYSDSTSSKQKVKSDGFNQLTELFRKYCYTVRVKKDLNLLNKGITQNELITRTISNTNFEDNKQRENNIGFKMSKSMGCEGGESANNGISNPIGLEVKVDIQGLEGNQSKNSKKVRLSNKQLREILNDFKENKSRHELIFNSGFTKQERIMLHKLAHKMKLMSKSFDEGAGRQLVIRKIMNVKTLKKRIQQGDPTLAALYDIVPPTIGVL